MIDAYEINALAQAKRPKQPSPETGLAIYDLADGSVLTLQLPPGILRGDAMTYEQKEFARVVREALTAAGQLDARRRELAADQTLSNFGRQEKLESARQNARINVAAARAEMETIERAAEGWIGGLFDPPKLKSDDVVGAMVDRECRDYLRSCPEKELTRILSNLETEMRTFEAIMRSPVTIPGVTDHAKLVWGEYVATTNPMAQRAAEYEGARDWAREVLNQVEIAIGA